MLVKYLKTLIILPFIAALSMLHSATLVVPGPEDAIKEYDVYDHEEYNTFDEEDDPYNDTVNPYASSYKKTTVKKKPKKNILITACTIMALTVGGITMLYYYQKPILKQKKSLKKKSRFPSLESPESEDLPSADDLDTGKKGIPDQPVGFKNFGNTCYFNTALQIFLSIPWIQTYLLDPQNTPENNTPGATFNLLKAILLRQGDVSILLRKIIQNLKKIDNKIGDGTQYYVDEALKVILQDLCKDITSSTAADQEKNNPIYKGWYGEIIEKNICTGCNKTKKSTVTDRMEALFPALSHLDEWLLTLPVFLANDDTVKKINLQNINTAISPIFPLRVNEKTPLSKLKNYITSQLKNSNIVFKGKKIVLGYTNTKKNIQYFKDLSQPIKNLGTKKPTSFFVLIVPEASDGITQKEKEALIPLLIPENTYYKALGKDNAINNAIENYSLPLLHSFEYIPTHEANCPDKKESKDQRYAIQETKIIKLPHILHLSNEMKGTAQNTKYPLELTWGGKNYGLSGIAIHTGTTHASGHYYGYVRYGEDRWFKVNDSYTSQTTADEVLKQKPCLWIYTQVPT